TPHGMTETDQMLADTIYHEMIHAIQNRLSPEDLKAVVDAYRETPSFRQFKRTFGRLQHFKYANTPHEILARVGAQYVAYKNGRRDIFNSGAHPMGVPVSSLNVDELEAIVPLFERMLDNAGLFTGAETLESS